jgi:multiple sugar transport system substrate-binding protein
MNVAALIYNRTLLDSLGLSAPRNMNLDQFIQLCRDIYARSGVRTSLVFGDAINWFHAVMRGQGQETYHLNPDGSFRQGGQLQHYQRFFAIVEQGIREGWHIPLANVAGRGTGIEVHPLVYPPNIQANAGHRVWFGVNWSGQIAAFQNLIEPGSQLALTTLPSDNPQRSNFGRASMFLSITSHTRNPNAAAALVSEWINNVEINRIDNTDRGLPINPNVVRGMTFSGPAQLNADYVAWFSQPGNSSPFSALAPPGLAEFRNMLENTTDQVKAGQLTVAAAAQLMFAEGNRLIR